MENRFQDFFMFERKVARAIESNFDSSESALEVIMQGTEAPMTTAANLASAKLVTVLKKIFPPNRKTIDIGQHDIH